jgi:hypothetical protein
MLALAALCLLLNTVCAQLREPFTQLTLPSNVLNGFFFPQSHNTVKMPNPFSENDTLTASQCAALFMSMGRASLDSTHVLADFSGFREHKDSVAHSAGCYSIALLDLLYLDFHPDALSSGMINRQNGSFFLSEGCSQSPCLQKESCVLWVDAPHIQMREYKFMMSVESFITNYTDVPDSVRINFDDGSGWQLLQSNEIYHADYSNEARNRIVRCQIYRNGRLVKNSACVLKYNDEYDVCSTSDMPYPVAPPWGSATNNPWDVQVEFEGGWVEGRAYTLISADGVFDKPFLFVEGIDFGLDRDGHPIHDWQRHGTFGWCEFASGFQDPDVNDDIIYGYDDLHLMPQLLQAIQLQGYDIVMIDFYDGATWLQRNSQLVQHVIRLCNEHKNGDESLVIAGASMGGVLSRHALRTMELNGEDHCARLWISLDAPHEGAHIPLSLQYAIRFSEEHGQEQAQLFRERYLLRPASKQMLDAQVFHSLDDYDAWYSPLREMGYPLQCRSVAISNGLATGQGLSYAENALMDWECDAAGVVHSKLLMYPESGNALSGSSGIGYPLLAHFRAPVIGWDAVGDEWYYWLGALVLGVVDAVDIDEQIIFTQEETVNRDYAPGGKRNTIQVFASAINSALDNVNDNSLNLSICPTITPQQYNPDHTFVSTSSSVGLQLDDPYADVSDYLWANSADNHFDRVWFAQNQNENHTELTESNLNVVLEEVLSFNLVQLDTALTALYLNSGVFNFGRPEYSYLNSIHIHQNGRLKINSYENTHFNESADYLSTQAHFEVSTQPCSSEIIRVDGGGILQIGDPTEEYRTGQLTIGRDSRLIIGNEGELIIYPGSTLVIEEGAVLEVYPGGKLRCQSGNVVVKSGGVCSFMGTPGAQYSHKVHLSGGDARLLFEGGQLHLDTQTTLSMDLEVDETGYMEILPGTSNMLHMQPHALFAWKGQSSNDLILKINNGAHLQNANWMQGGIEFGEGLVDLTYNGAIYTDAPFTARNVHFYASDQWEAEGSEVWKWFGACTLEECLFEHVDLKTMHSKLTMSACDMVGPNSGVEAYEGGFMISGTSFDNAVCTSSELEALSVISDCSFYNNSGVNDYSEQRLLIKESLFSDLEGAAIKKYLGELSLKCNQFENCGSVVVNQAELDMSLLQYGGLNSFSEVVDCIQVNELRKLSLEDGGNDFSGCTQYIITGTIDTLCAPLSCGLYVNAAHNHWGYNAAELSLISGLSFPSQDQIALVSTALAVCSNYEMDVACQIMLTDSQPVVPQRCDDSGKTRVAEDFSFHKYFDDFLNGRCPASNDEEVNVYNAAASLVLTIGVKKGDFLNLDLEEFSVGLYLISITGNEIYSTKMVVSE